MALKAGRVGVAPSQVDNNGNVIGGGSSVTVVDNLNSTSSTDALSAKQGSVLKSAVDNKEDASKIGGFEFRVNDGTAQYRTSSSGEWLNFNSGGGEGVVLPSPSTEGVEGATINEGGYQIDIDSGMCYVNINITNSSNRLSISGLPHASVASPVCFVNSTGRFSYANVSTSGAISSGPNSALEGTYSIIGVYPCS